MVDINNGQWNRKFNKTYEYHVFLIFDIGNIESETVENIRNRKKKNILLLTSKIEKMFCQPNCLKQ